MVAVRIASLRMLPEKYPPSLGGGTPNRIGVADGGTDQHGRTARDYGYGWGALSIGRSGEQRSLDELCKMTGWRRKHAIRKLAERDAPSAAPDAPRRRQPTYGATIKDALVALWEASDRICGKRLKVMIPILLPALERHGRLELTSSERALVLGASAATIDRHLVDTKVAASGGRRRRVGCSPSGPTGQFELIA